MNHILCQENEYQFKLKSHSLLKLIALARNLQFPTTFHTLKNFTQLISCFSNTPIQTQTLISVNQMVSFRLQVHMYTMFIYVQIHIQVHYSTNNMHYNTRPVQATKQPSGNIIDFKLRSRYVDIKKIRLFAVSVYIKQQLYTRFV